MWGAPLAVCFLHHSFNFFLHSGHKKDEMERDGNTKGYQEKGKEKDAKRKGCGEEMRGTVQGKGSASCQEEHATGKWDVKRNISQKMSRAKDERNMSEESDLKRKEMKRKRSIKKSRCQGKVMIEERNGKSNRCQEKELI